jgi:AraC-like DNA-binding protein
MPVITTTNAIAILRKHAAEAGADAVAEVERLAAEPTRPAHPTPRKIRAARAGRRRAERTAHRREKHFGRGPVRAMDRNAKVRIRFWLERLKRPTERGRHYGEITGKAYDVAIALLWTFHNARSGLCFPSYAKIAAAAGCAEKYVAELIHMLERAGVLTWVNRLRREPAAPGSDRRTQVVRTSNGYKFNDPPSLSSKSELRTGTALRFSTEELLPRQEVSTDGETVSLGGRTTTSATPWGEKAGLGGKAVEPAVRTALKARPTDKVFAGAKPGTSAPENRG